MERLLALALGLYSVTTLTSMAIMSIGATLALLSLVVFFAGRFGLALREEVARPNGRLYLLAASGLAFACILSLVVGKLDPMAYGGKFSQVHVLRDSLKLWYLFWPIPLAAGLRALGGSRRDSVLRSWMIAFGVVSLIGIAQFWTGWPRPQWIPGTNRHYHATLFLGHHLSVASSLIFPFFVSLDLALRSLKKREKVLGFAAPVWIALAAAGLCTLFFTYSRTLWVALPLGIVLWVLFSLPARRAIFLALAFAVAGAALTQVPIVKERLFYGGGFSTRAELWRANLDMFHDRPFTGVGWLHNQETSGYYLMNKFQSTDVFSGHAHNNVLDVLGGTGAIGLVFWLFWSAVALILAWRARAVWGPGLFCAWLVFQMNGLTQMNFWDAKVTHQMMLAMAWLVLGVA
ncbi:MAG: O-antigen ligase family protein [Oligoflexia bacterium]|nr:O-antigen ligase family protein [Oligoflexia bacterium]